VTGCPFDLCPMTGTGVPTLCSTFVARLLDEMFHDRAQIRDTMPLTMGGSAPFRYYAVLIGMISMCAPASA
jgi:hypothetical protein